MQFVTDLTYLETDQNLREVVEQNSFVACQVSVCTTWLIVIRVAYFSQLSPD